MSTVLGSLRRPSALSAAALASVLTGSVLAASNASVPVMAIVLIAIVAVGASSISVEAVLVALIFTSPAGLEPLTAGERSLFENYGGWAVSSLRLGVMLLAGMAVLALRSRRPRRLLLEEYLYLALVAWTTTTLVFSPDPLYGVRFTLKLGVLIIAWLAFESILHKYGERFLWRVLLATLATALLIDYAMLATGLGFYHVFEDNSSRFSGLAGSPASGALSLGALALGALYLWLRFRNRAALLLYALTWVPILFSVTRIAIFGFAIASIFLTSVMSRWRETAIIALAICTIVFSYSPVRERMTYGASQSWQSIAGTVRDEGIQGVNTEGRVDLWHVLSEKFHAHPIVGSGVGSSEATLREAGSFVPEQQAHSDYLALLVNGGVIALGLWLAALGGLVVRFARKGGSAPAAAAGLVLYLLAAVTDNAIEMYALLGIPVAALIALALGTEDPRRRNHRIDAST